MAAQGKVLTKDEVAKKLAAHLAELHSFGVRSLDLFGSVVRGEANSESDVDLLVSFDVVPGMFGYVRLRNRLQQILGSKVNLVTASGLKPRIRDRVLREALRIA